MIRSQICLTSVNYKFKYYIEYQDDIQYNFGSYSYSSTIIEREKKMRMMGCSEEEIEAMKQDTPKDCLFVNKEYDNIYRDNNDFIRINNVDGSLEEVSKVNESSIDILFPAHSITTYNSNITYIIGVYTFINGVKVQLGSYTIHYDDIVAVNRKTRRKSVDYLNTYNVKFPDPWYLCYSDDWKNWRDSLGSVKKEEFNNEGSTLYVELIPVKDYGDKFNNINGYSGGSCCIPFSTINNDHMELRTTPIVDEGSRINVKLVFNDVYKGNVVDYFSETYQWDISSFRPKFEIVIGDDGGIYNSWSTEDENIVPSDKITLSCTEVDFNKNVLGIKDWSNWRPGMFLIGSYSLIDEYGAEIFTIKSNPIPATVETFKFFINTELTDYLNLDYIHMQSYQVDVVNKINKQIIKVNKPDDYKANILKPIFVKSYKIDDTILHPKVTESVCIDLNPYKSKVSMFYIKIEDVEFVELGRTPMGVVFKINGSMLPNKKQNGIFYILNEQHELVVTGNYTYIQ